MPLRCQWVEWADDKIPFHLSDRFANDAFTAWHCMRSTVDQIGTTVFVTGLFMGIGAPLGGFLSTRIDIRLLASMGFLLLAGSTWLGSGITSEWRFWELFWPQALRGTGIMFCIVSVSVMAFATLPQAQIKDSTGLFTLFRNMGGAAGIAIINTILQIRTNFHQARLAESANPGRAEIAERLEFSNEYNFSRFFRRLNACSPSAWRQHRYAAGFELKFGKNI